MNIENGSTRSSTIAYEPTVPSVNPLATFATYPSTLKKPKHSMLRRVCHSKITQAFLPKDLKKDGGRVASESIASAAERPNELTKYAAPNELTKYVNPNKWTPKRLVEKYGRSATDALKLVRDTHISVLTPAKETSKVRQARNCVKKVARDVRYSFRDKKRHKETEHPSRSILDLVKNLKNINNESNGFEARLDILMKASATRLADDDLEETILAIKDERTRDALLRDVANDQAIELKTVLEKIEQQARQELERRYKTQPLLSLIEAYEDQNKKFNPPQDTARTANLTDDEAFQLQKETSLQIHTAMRMLLRGNECEHLRVSGQKQQEFFAEVVRTVPQEKLESLRIVMGLEQYGELWRMSAVRSETSKVMSAYILRTYDEVGIAIQARDASVSIRRNDNSNLVDWPDLPVGAAHPDLKAGWLRRAGSEIAQRVRYTVGTGPARAQIRAQYLENNIDKRTKALLQKLVRTPHYDNGATQAAIFRLQDRFHEAIDALDAERTKIQLPGLTNAHVTEAVQRVLGEFNGESLKDISKKLQSWPTPPSPQADPTPGILNWARNKLHLLGLHWRNRFHDHAQIKLRRGNWKSGNDRRLETLDAIRRLLPQERLIRSTHIHLKDLSPLLTKGADKDYGGITEIIRKLSVLGAENHGGSPDFHMQICKAALHRLNKSELDIVMNRLYKYSGRYGKKMQAFYKAEQSRNDLATNEDYMLKKLLETLYSAGLQLNWEPRPDGDQDSSTETDSSGFTTPTRSSDSSPVRAATEALEFTHTTAQILPVKQLLALRNA